jgi:hypothetical protein
VVCGCCPAEIVVPNTASNMDISVAIVESCQVEVSALADHSSRGILPNVVPRCVSFINPKNVGAMSRDR